MKPEGDCETLEDDLDEDIYFYELPLIADFPLFGPQPELRGLLRYSTHSEFQEKMGVPAEADTAVEWAWGLSEEEQTKYAEERREIGRPPHHLYVNPVVFKNAIWHC